MLAKYRRSKTALANRKEGERYYLKVETEEGERGLRKRFLLAVQRAVYFIRERPKASHIYFDDVRIHHLAGFPYSLLYIYDEKLNQVSVLVLLCQHWSAVRISGELKKARTE